MQLHYPHPGADYFNFEGLVEILVEKHLECSCGCSVQPYHCHPLIQVYDSLSCQCRCLNETSTCSYPYHWDNGTCTCKCVNETKCQSPQIMNNLTCQYVLRFI